MAGLENLFAAEPTLPSSQTKKLPDDPQAWPEVITTELRERYPETTRLPLMVEFRKKDAMSGTAIGAIHVTASDDPKKSLVVPFIARKFELFPLDVWMEAKTQEVHPLTNDTFKEVFFVTSMAEGLDQRPADAAGQYFNDPSLWTSNYPPLQGRYSYASAGYPILDQISDSIKKEHLAAFIQYLEKNATILPRFKKHGHLEIVSTLAKLAKKTGPDTNNFAESAMKLLPRGAVSVKKESTDKYSILSFADQLFDLAACENTYLNKEDCAKFLSKITAKPWDFLHEVDQEGERMLIMKKAPEKGVFLYDDIREKPELANDFAVYCVRDKMGLDTMGAVFPYVIDFNGKKQGVKLFISPTHASMQTQIAGVKRPDSDYFLKLFKPTPGARVGQTGTFVYIDDGKALATVPVTIKALEHSGDMTAVKLDGTKIRIRRSWSDNPAMEAVPSPVGGKPAKQKSFLDAHGMLEVRPREYVIPKKMVWIPMEGFQDVSSSASDWLMKEAAQHAEMNPLTIRYTGIVFDLSGSGMEKVSLDERRTKLLLAIRGATLDKVAQIIKKARTAGRVKVHGLQPLRKKADIVKLANETYTDLEKVCASIRCQLIKEAAEVEDSLTVDALLSLNFLNPENLSKFVSYRPIFEKVLDYVSELTLACRLGIKDLSEGALVTTMSRLQEVCSGLKRVENGLKKPGIKTASAKGGDDVSFVSGLNKNAASAPKAAAKPAAGAAASKGAPAPGGGSDPFADGMADGEMGTHIYIDRHRKDSKSMLAYMNGKRLSEQNKATAAMAIGMQPPNGMKPQKPQAPAKPAGGAKK